MVHREKIIVFDSGVGGVSVLRHLRRMLPGEDFLYFGDDAHAPYGKRTTEQVRQLTLTIIGQLLEQYPVKALVIACNTATSAAICDLRAKYPHLIVIGIEPALKPAADRFPGGHIGIMATDVTLREKKLNDLVQRYAQHCQISCISAPGLVELIEQGFGDSTECVELLQGILSPYRGKLDALVLGCTHYPFAQSAIRLILGDHTLLLDGGEGTARQTRRRLNDAGLLNEDSGNGSLEILHSSQNPDFIPRVRALME